MQYKTTLTFRSRSLFLSFIFIPLCAGAQKRSYEDSLLAYRQKYVNTHEVVDEHDRKFIEFYDVDSRYCINAAFKKIEDNVGFDMNTSSGKKKRFYKYGMLSFRLLDSLVHLYVYQSGALIQKEEMKQYLFVPFGDATSGSGSYGGGRYIDLSIPAIANNYVILDFNKAYNPYCAYTTGYNCPIPPIENLLPVAINAGEKNYAKGAH